MPIGDNELNILLLEVGFKKALTYQGRLISEATLTTGVHPLLVAPKMIRYSDPTRTDVTQTTGGALVTKGGRGLRTVTLEGTFGVDVRGLLFYLGTGEVRFKRLYKEVVRMGDAMFSDDVQESVDILNGTPGISLLVKPFDESDSTFYVNWYDFWNDISFQTEVMDFTWHREHRNGGAQGLVHYRMTLKEVGPIVTGNLTSQIIGGLMQALTFWDGLNNVIESYTIGNIIDSVAVVGDIVSARIEDSQSALKAQIDSITSLMGGSSGGSSGASGSQASTTANESATGAATGGTASATDSSGLATLQAQEGSATFFSNADALSQDARELGDEIGRNLDPFDSETGAIEFSAQFEEGGSSALSLFDEIVKARDLEDTALFQTVVGVFFGMSRAEYQDYVTAGGSLSQQAPEIGGSIRHVVSDTDTAASLEAEFNVTFDRILAVNRLTPDEALFPGTELQIPRVRVRGPQGIKGLPTFGSHVGQQAWGSDLQAALEPDSENRPVVVSGSDVLVQGADFLVSIFGDPLLKQLDRVHPRVRDDYVAKQLAEIFKSDERVAAISEVNIADIDSGLDVQVTIETINGGTVRTGA